MNEYLPIVVPVFAAIAAILGSWLTVRAGKKKAGADAAETLTDIALSLVEPLKIELEELKIEVGLLKRENEVLHKWAQLLFSQVIEEGGEPVSFDQVKKLLGRG